MSINQDIQTREFLQRASVRTMKKDLANLRELDSLEERKKIGQIKPNLKRNSF